jgi:TonB family protein
VQGTAWVLAVVTASGCVLDESVGRPVDPELDIQALRAVARWTFRPASLDAEPIANAVVIEVSFTIKKK